MMRKGGYRYTWARCLLASGIPLVPPVKRYTTNQGPMKRLSMRVRNSVAKTMRRDSDDQPLPPPPLSVLSDPESQAVVEHGVPFHLPVNGLAKSALLSPSAICSYTVSLSTPTLPIPGLGSSSELTDAPPPTSMTSHAATVDVDTPTEGTAANTSLAQSPRRRAANMLRGHLPTLAAPSSTSTTVAVWPPSSAPKSASEATPAHDQLQRHRHVEGESIEAPPSPPGEMVATGGADSVSDEGKTRALDAVAQTVARAPAQADGPESTEAEWVEAARAKMARGEAERAEAERVEAERAEAERVEAERAEAERVEAERMEAERVEAERVKAERAEAERVEAERVEAARVKTELLEAEAARLEAARVEAAKAAAEAEARRVAEAEAVRAAAEAARLAAEEAAAKEAAAKEAEEFRQPEMLTLNRKLGTALFSQGRLEEAAALQERILAVGSEVHRRMPPDCSQPTVP